MGTRRCDGLLHDCFALSRSARCPPPTTVASRPTVCPRLQRRVPARNQARPMHCNTLRDAVFCEMPVRKGLKLPERDSQLPIGKLTLQSLKRYLLADAGLSMRLCSETTSAHSTRRYPAYRFSAACRLQPFRVTSAKNAGAGIGGDSPAPRDGGAGLASLASWVHSHAARAIPRQPPNVPSFTRSIRCCQTSALPGRAPSTPSTSAPATTATSPSSPGDSTAAPTCRRTCLDGSTPWSQPNLDHTATTTLAASA